MYKILVTRRLGDDGVFELIVEAYARGFLVGWVKGMWDDKEHDWYVTCVGTERECRGFGIASRLLHRFEWEAWRITSAPIRLWVLPIGDSPFNRKKLKAWYRRRGFEDLNPSKRNLHYMRKSP